jgi:hypothetical protein
VSPCRGCSQCRARAIAIAAETIAAETIAAETIAAAETIGSVACEETVRKTENRGRSTLVAGAR